MKPWTFEEVELLGDTSLNEMRDAAKEGGVQYKTASIIADRIAALLEEYTEAERLGGLSVAGMRALRDIVETEVEAPTQ
jgi:hypothetical protein